MKRMYFPIAALMAAATLQAQTINFTGIYLENFDGMGPAGLVLPTGWSAVRYAGTGTLGDPLAPAVSTGASTGGGIYNVGVSLDADRALGSLASGATSPRFGVQLVNNTGSTITDLQFAGVSEQWRTGANDTINETIGFEYSLDAADINDGAATFTALSGMDLVEVQTASTSGGAIDGNDAANQAALSGALSGLNWADGATLTLRWSDVDVTGGDGMYALDNFSVTATTAVPEPSTWAIIGLSIAGFLARWRRSA